MSSRSSAAVGRVCPSALAMFVRPLGSILAVHGSLQWAVIESHAAAFDIFSGPVGHLECSKAKPDLATLISLRHLADRLRSRGNHDFAISLVVVFDHSDHRSLHCA